MPKPYSMDLRQRVIESIAAGASRREAAEHYGISPSIAVLWAQRWNATGSIEARPTGGSVSPLEDHAAFLLALVTEQPDLTLNGSLQRWPRSGSSVAALRCGVSTIDTA
jgi:transposase